MARLTKRIAEVRQDYFDWLCNIIGVENEHESFVLLANDLWNTEFVSLVPHDENRIGDVMQLRKQYLDEVNCYDGWYLDGFPCNMLEVLIALAGRMDFEISEPEDFSNHTAIFFWDMMRNLGLDRYADEVYVQNGGMENVKKILKKMIWREYEGDGHGGLFPLCRPHEDQRKVELWYQMQEYLNENFSLKEA